MWYSQEGSFSTLNFMSFKFSIRIIRWEMNNLEFFNDICFAYIFFPFQGIFLRWLQPLIFVTGGLGPPPRGLPFFYTTAPY